MSDIAISEPLGAPAPLESRAIERALSDLWKQATSELAGARRGLHVPRRGTLEELQPFLVREIAAHQLGDSGNDLRRHDKRRRAHGVTVVGFAVGASPLAVGVHALAPVPVTCLIASTM